MKEENMTSKELMKERFKLANKLTKGPILNENSYERSKRYSDRQVSQTRGFSYAWFSGIVPITLLTILPEDSEFIYSISIPSVLTLYIAIVISLVLFYGILPKITSKRILTYRFRYNIIMSLYVGTSYFMWYRDSYIIWELENETVLPMKNDAIYYIILAIILLIIQKKLENKVYLEREKDIFQKRSFNDWSAKKIFDYEHMSEEQRQQEIENLAKNKEKLGYLRELNKKKRKEQKEIIKEYKNNLKEESKE
ncbi:MAG: hypothetical protein ACK5HR_01060 [Mycoplasmatales bacterium]